MTDSNGVLSALDEDPYDDLTMALGRAQSMVDVLRSAAHGNKELDAELELRQGSLEGFLFTVDHHLDEAKAAGRRMKEALWTAGEAGPRIQSSCPGKAS